MTSEDVRVGYVVGYVWGGVRVRGGGRVHIRAVGKVMSLPRCPKL